MVGDANRLYRIRSAETYGFFAGTAAGGRQVLMGLHCPYLVAIFFDADGSMAEVQKRHLEFLQLRGGGAIPTHDIFDERIPVRLEAWQQEMGFAPGVIRVWEFVVPELGIALQDRPEHFAETLDDPAASADDKERTRKAIQEWDAQGFFVLLWGNDYWLDSTGEVDSS